MNMRRSLVRLLPSRHFRLLSSEVRKQKASTEKTIKFSNWRSESVSECDKTVTFTSNHDFACFLNIIRAISVEDSDGRSHRGLADMDDSRCYSISYAKEVNDSTGVRFQSHITNNAISFEGIANLAVVNNLVDMGHTGVKILYEHKIVEADGSGPLPKGSTVCDFDGVVSTNSHLFVVEAKLHAKVPDIGQAFRNMLILKDPEYKLIDPGDSRPIVGVIATSTASNKDLEQAARVFGAWLLTTDGSNFKFKQLGRGPIAEYGWHWWR